MLVLSRKTGQSISIGEHITITISRIAGNRASISVDAPKHVRILRSELHIGNNNEARHQESTVVSDSQPLMP